VVNLVDARGHVLSLHQAGVELSPLAAWVEPISAAASLPAFTAFIDAEAPVAVTGNRLTVGELEVDFTAAEPWESRPAWGRIAPGAIARGRRSMIATLLAEAPAGSLAPLLSGGDHLPAAVEPFRQAADDLRLGIAHHDAVRVAAAATRLAGRGPGLTPAGDDFLIGALHALWAAGGDGTRDQLVEVIARAAPPRTGALPAAWIAAAGKGEAAESWHSLVAALANEDGAAVAAATSFIARIGHTSGADALAGFLVALEAIDTPDRFITIATTGHDR
jgi:hypothetical protein